MKYLESDVMWYYYCTYISHTPINSAVSSYALLATYTSSLACNVIDTYGVLKVGHHLPASRREEVGGQRTHLLQRTKTRC